MKRTISLLSLAFAGMLGCDKQTVEATPPPATTAAPAVVAPPPEPPAAPKKDSEKTVVDVAVGSPDHTTLVAAIVAAGLAPSLASPGGVYTVFAPTNAAFAKLPKGTVTAGGSRTQSGSLPRRLAMLRLLAPTTPSLNSAIPTAHLPHHLGMVMRRLRGAPSLAPAAPLRESIVLRVWRKMYSSVVRMPFV